MERWQDIENEREKYAAYLCSREWAEKREAVRARAKGRCERCLRAPMEACHHLTYERKYKELLEDLQGTCRPCHEFTHGKSDRDPRLTPIPPTFSAPDPGGAVKLLCPICGSDEVILVSHLLEVKEEYPPTVSLIFGCSGDHSFHLCFLSEYVEPSLYVFTGRFANYT